MAFGDVIRYAASPSNLPYGIGGDANTIWHCDRNESKIYELSTTDFSQVRDAASPSLYPYGIGGDANTIWHCNPNSDLIYELSTTDFSNLREAASPSSDPYGIGGDANTIWNCDNAADRIYELDVTDFSNLRGAASPAAFPIGIGGDANTIWHCDPNSDLIYELSTTDFSQVRDAASPSLHPYGIGGDANTIWHCNYIAAKIYELDAALVVAPTVTTQAADLVEATTATGNGNITDNGGENCTRRGIAYGTTSIDITGVKTASTLVLADSESFETNLGDWVNDGGNGTDWTRFSGATGSSNTGPTTAYDGTWYIYIECSFPTAYDVDDEQIIEYDIGSSENGYVDFYYHQYGVDQGALYLEGYNGSSWVEIWSSTGDQGNQWNHITSADSAFTAYSKLRFRNVSAGGYYGDVALDLVKVYTGNAATYYTIDDYDDYEESVGDFGTGAFEESLTGLTSDTTYYARAYAYNTAGCGYGAEVAFDTLVAVVAPTVTTQAADLVEATTARGNGNITDTGGENCTRRGFCYKVGTTGDPTTADSVAYDDGSFGTGAYTKGLTGLSTGTSYRVRAYAVNSAGTGYGATVQILTKPAAPTSVAASDGTYTDKVRITWTKSTGATGYKVYEGANLLDTLGDVALYDDTAAPAPTITPGTASASDGTSADYVTLSLAGESVANGTSRTYKVVATNATGDSADSSTNTGYRGHGALTYQWYRSAGDSDASYSSLGGATTDPYNDTTAPTDGDGRYYKCYVSATGASSQYSTADRGYRAVAYTKSLSDSVAITDSIIKAPSLNKGDTVAIADALARVVEFYRVESDTIAIADAITKAVGLPEADSIALADTILKAVGLNKADTLAIADAILIGNAFIKSFSDTIIIADSLIKAVGQPHADSVAISDSLSKVSAFLRSLSDTITISDSIADVVDFLLSIGDSVAITDVIEKAIGQSQGDTVAIVDSIIKGVGLNEADSVAIADVIVKAIELAQADNVAISDSIADVVEFYLAIADSMVIGDATEKAIGLVETDSVAIADVIVKAVGMAQSDSVAIADSLVKAIGMPLSDAVTIADSLSKGAGLNKADIVAIIDAIVFSGSYPRPGIQVAAYLFSRAITAQSRREF